MYPKRDGWNVGTNLQLTTITIPLYYKLQWCSRFSLFHHTLTYHTLYHSPYQQGQRDQFHLTGMWKTLMFRSCVIHVEWKVVLAPWKEASSLLPASLFLLGEAYCFEFSPWLLADDAKSVLVVFFCQCSQSVTIVSR